ncbi:MAG: hypothetical protein HC880_21815 [Bacteroidia bacterium]|nr:hypothetical protein [Bacteroidia bacterium]
MKFYLTILLAGLSLWTGFTQTISPGATSYAYDIYPTVYTRVDFSKKLRDWDGFGFNYVETAQTWDYEKDPQEYGGFSLLDEQEKQKIIDLIFGEDGLKVGLVKMFLDPHHQQALKAPFDHRTTTEICAILCARA